MFLIAILLGLAAFGAVLLFFWYASQSIEQRIEGRSSLKAIESYSWQGNDLVGKEHSFLERVMVPLNARSLELAKRFTPVGYIESKRQMLIVAGRRGPDELDRFLVIRVLSLVGAVLALPIGLALLPGPPGKKLLMAAVIAAAFVFMPDARLKSAAQSRQKQIRRALPDTMDLLTISVEAGLGFEQAIDRITTSVDGPLSVEFSRMIGEMRAGAARAEALNALDQRTQIEEVKTFVLAMVQADQFGISIGRVLRAQSDEMRIKRRQLAQEAAQKAPVKMLLPMTFFIFPALFVVLLGPAAMKIVENLGST